MFCYACIKDWAAVTNTCPLCKQKFGEMVKFSEDGKSSEVIKVEEKKQVYEENLEEFIESKERGEVGLGIFFQ